MNYTNDMILPRETGKNGSLEIVFQNDVSGKTIIKEQFSKVPLYIQKALHYDDFCLDLAYLYIVSVSGGILQGDRYETNITMEEKSKAHITTQGATRIYGMNNNYATQIINITLKNDSYLEFIPDQIIPYRNSRYYQRVNLNIHDSATMIYSEIVTPGRIAMGELFEYDLCYLNMRVTNQENYLRLLDVTNLDPKNKLETFGVLGDNRIFGSIYILTRKNVKKIHEKIKETISKSRVSSGVSIIKDDSGLIVRILGDETDTIKDVILEIVKCVREICIGFSISDIRKN